MVKDPVQKTTLTDSFVSITLGFLVVVVAGLLIYNQMTKGKNQEKAAETKKDTWEEKTADLPSTHTVLKGDNLWKIAEKYYGSGYNWVTVARENNLKNPDRLTEAMFLNIPKAELIKRDAEKIASEEIQKPKIYTVIGGDSLWKIAVKHYSNGYEWIKIAQANNLKNPDLLFVGTVLNLP